MRIPLPRQTRIVKKVLPRGLLARSLLLISVPLVILLGIALQFFYGPHLNIVSRRLAGAVAGEIGLTVAMLERPDLAREPGSIPWTLNLARQKFELAMRLRPGARLSDHPGAGTGPADDELAGALREKVGRPFVLDWTADPQSVVVRVALADAVLEVDAPRKRLTTSALYLFLFWVVGGAALVFVIAALFMRIQVRAIRRLAAAAEAFGLGRDRGPIKPEGAAEVRQAAGAFNRMQERILRFLTQRTEMLAGVSHDLRTPLTRLKLALAMLPADARTDADVAAMGEDVAEMERMVEGYLAFARGEGDEQAVATDLGRMLEDIAADARRAGARVEFAPPDRLTLRLRPMAVRRAIMNLVDNARRHAGRIALSVTAAGRFVEVAVDDDGPGIRPDRREDVFRPFTGSSKEDMGGATGLGLTIARDIARAHGGDVTLEESALGGLRARVRLPV